MRAALILLSASAVAVSAARAEPDLNPMPSVRADDWARAAEAAATNPDALAATLVAYFRALAPASPGHGGADAAEIAGFAAAHPDWPAQAQLLRRREEALAAEPDDARARAACATRPVSAPALLRCARAASTLADAAGYAVAAWTGAGITDPAAEAAFTKAWSGAIGAADEWVRFDTLAWAAGAQPASSAPASPALAARRQLARLDLAQRALAGIRLGLQRNDKPTLDEAAARHDPDLFLDLARALRRADRDADALALWQAQGAVAQAAFPAHAAEFWTERNVLARRLLRAGDAEGAYALADTHGQTAVEAAADAEFLAGFIALRRLSDPARARPHFTRLRALSNAAITRARADYWLGRAAAQTGDDPRPDYAGAADFPLTFYGQRAAVALGETNAELAARIDAARDPAWSEQASWGYASGELLRAATLLIAWGEPRRAVPFLLRADELAGLPEARAFVAAFAARAGLADAAVAIARRMGRDGLALPEQGWPAPYDIPTALEPALALGIMRQESSFDPEAVSPSGARGLMQLMPATAQAVARDRHESVTLAALTADPLANVRLGATYLASLLDSFAGATPLAVAAYNAGPNRVREWLAQNGDPRGADAAAMIDWIELIPFNETRNYVQRVLENTVIYRARLHRPGPALLASDAS